MATLLTDAVATQVEVERHQHEERIDKARVIVETWLEAQKKGVVRPADVLQVGKRAVRDLGAGHRERILGQLADEMNFSPPTGRLVRGAPAVMHKLVRVVAKRIAAAEKLKIQAKDTTLWERTAEVFTQSGFDLNVRQARTFYYYQNSRITCYLGIAQCSVALH